MLCAASEGKCVQVCAKRIVCKGKCVHFRCSAAALEVVLVLFVALCCTKLRGW